MFAETRYDWNTPIALARLGKLAVGWATLLRVTTGFALTQRVETILLLFKKAVDFAH
jgi:hypothetical protein